MTNFGILGAFIHAGLVNKFIFILLLILSVYSWAIIIRKYMELKEYRKSFIVFQQSLRTKELESLKTYVASNSQGNPYTYMLNLLLKKINKVPLERLVSQAEIILFSSVEEVEDNVSKLAIIASSAPFIGLLGTVIGVINSFNNIALQASVSLATIAPGIAESLYATALGLFVSIPAMVAYNMNTSKIESYKEAFATILEQVIFVIQTENTGATVANPVNSVTTATSTTKTENPATTETSVTQTDEVNLEK